MKSLRSDSLLALSLCIVSFVSGCQLSADITINPFENRGEVDPKVYGHFIENLMHCIYGGIWEDNPQVPVIHGGMRTDVLEKVKELKPPVTRWPGGLYADAYHWKNGIGPVEGRPVMFNPYWFILAPLDTNHFGTDEFMTFLDEVGGEAYINVNLGTGTPEEAAQWVEYTNGGVETEYGALRAEYGHPEPYNVKYWGVGNETYGFWARGHTDAVSYANRYVEFCEAMREKDPEIQFDAVGESREWNRAVLEIAGEYVDYLAIHIYIPQPFFFVNVEDSEEDYYSIVASPLYIDQILREVMATIEEIMGEDSEIRIALDEWNVWWNFLQLLESNYSLREGIFAAGALNVFHRLGKRMGMANIAQLVDVFGLLQTNETDVFHTPLFSVFELYVNHAEDTVVKAEVESPTFRSRRMAAIPSFRNVPYLDCSATYNQEENRLSMMVVNRHFDDCIRARIHLKNFHPQQDATVWELNAASPFSRNDFDRKNEVRIRRKELQRLSPNFDYTFPPHSVSALVIQGE